MNDMATAPMRSLALLAGETATMQRERVEGATKGAMRRAARGARGVGAGGAGAIGPAADGDHLFVSFGRGLLSWVGKNYLCALCALCALCGRRPLRPLRLRWPPSMLSMVLSKTWVLCLDGAAAFFVRPKSLLSQFQFIRLSLLHIFSLLLPMTTIEHWSSLPGMRDFLLNHRILDPDDMIGHVIDSADGSVNARLAHLWLRLTQVGVDGHDAFLVVTDIGNMLNISLNDVFHPHTCALLITKFAFNS